MTFPEETIARDLHRVLTREFKSSPTVVSVRGAGVHWACTARRGDLCCQISCFASREPEYYTSFSRDSEELATSRIPSRSDTIAAVRDWLDGQGLSVLYERYSFLDRIKHALTKMLDDVVLGVPELQSLANPRLIHQFGDFYYLQFDADIRSCKISFYGKNPLPDAAFSWDDCQLFQFQPDDHEQLAFVLKRWLCEHAMPSEMRREFPWLDIGELADYYERGKPIEGEFIQSWDFIEGFFSHGWLPCLGDVSAMISAMRAAGYDRQLRAGQSMWSLGLSRSRRHGLKDEQPHIWFEFHDASMDVRPSFDAEGLEDHPIAFSSDVRQLLDRLVDFDVE